MINEKGYVYVYVYKYIYIYIYIERERDTANHDKIKTKISRPAGCPRG